MSSKKCVCGKDVLGNPPVCMECFCMGDKIVHQACFDKASCSERTCTKSDSDDSPIVAMDQPDKACSICTSTIRGGETHFLDFVCLNCHGKSITINSAGSRERQDCTAALESEMQGLCSEVARLRVALHRLQAVTGRFQAPYSPVPLPGEHQAINCGLALALLDQLKQEGMAIDDEQAMEGLAAVYLPGRMETLCQDPHVLVDGAHNAASIKALMRALAQHVPYDSMVLVFGCAADKDIEGMMAQIATGADKVIFTKATDNARASKPEDLARVYDECSGRIAQVTQNLREAIQVANSAVSREDVICITGSFAVVGEAKTLLGN